jgi:lipopolysaccharide export system ATP-binding protein
MKLEIIHLQKSYDNRRVVHDVSLSVQSGDVVTILGPNGAGKTTCFGMIAGLIKPDSGDVLLDNKNITSMSIHKRAAHGIVYLPQESSVFKSLSVADNIMIVLEVMLDSYEERIRRLEELLGEFSISHLKYAQASTLSGGERRRLEIARSIAACPKFILLDEPFAGVDPISVIEIKNLITHLKSRNIGILITDHNVRDTLNITDEAYIMYDGKIITSGTADEVVGSDIARQKYLGRDFAL